MKKLLVTLAVLAGLVSAAKATPVTYIQSKNTLQSGTTIYVTSGTLTNLQTTTLKFADGTSQTTAASAPSTAWANYRRPVLQYNSGTQVNLETGTNGTSGATRVLFPDGSVYTETQSTLLNAVISSTANWGNGTQVAGIRPTEKQTNNTWEAFYAVKSTQTLPANTTDFVVVMSSWMPLQANFSTLNGFFGTNSWVYLGVVPYGDGGGTANAFTKFVMAGNRVSLYNVGAGQSNTPGVREGSGAGVTSVTWNYAAGSLVSSQQVPGNLTLGTFTSAMQTGGTLVKHEDAGATMVYYLLTMSGANVSTTCDVPLVDGFKQSSSGTLNQDMWMRGYVDGALGVGSNPLL